MSPEILPQLFNMYREIHSAQLGVLLGLFVGLLYRDRPALAYALLFLGVLSAFGNASRIGFQPAPEIETKPWYFLSGLYVSTVANLLLVKYAPAMKRRVSRIAAGVTRSDGPRDDAV
jgi:phosphotransferase system  glucose/maltose/N-acetylglucosamine-specific IIC component